MQFCSGNAVTAHFVNIIDPQQFNKQIVKAETHILRALTFVLAAVGFRQPQPL